MIIIRTKNSLKQMDVYFQCANALGTLPGEGYSPALECADTTECAKNAVARKGQRYTSKASAPLNNYGQVAEF